MDTEVINKEEDKEQLHIFQVQIKGCTREQALQVLSERLGHDEDYGFSYSINW